MDEYNERYEQAGDNARDDDGVLFGDDVRLGGLEVAHILPHSLLKRSDNLELVCEKVAFSSPTDPIRP